MVVVGFPAANVEEEGEGGGCDLVEAAEVATETGGAAMAEEDGGELGDLREVERTRRSRSSPSRQALIATVAVLFMLRNIGDTAALLCFQTHEREREREREREKERRLG